MGKMYRSIEVHTLAFSAPIFEYDTNINNVYIMRVKLSKILILYLPSKSCSYYEPTKFEAASESVSSLLG